MTKWSDGIAKHTLADQVAERIISQIAKGVLGPGDALPSQRDLAREIGISLPAVREAMQRLQMLRVIKTQHGSGMVVAEIGWQQIVLEPSLLLVALEGDALRNMWEARHAIESEVVRLAAIRATDDDLAVIQSVLDEAGPFRPDFESNRDLNHQFHIGVAKAAKNPVLEDMLSGLLAIDLSAIRKIYSEAISRRSWDVHQLIFKAVANHDPVAAVKAMELHAMALDSEMMIVDDIVQAGEASTDAAVKAPAKKGPRARRGA